MLNHGFAKALGCGGPSLLLSALLLSACGEVPDREAPEVERQGGVEQAFPGKSGQRQHGDVYWGDFKQSLTYEEIEGQAVLEGDMLIAPHQLEAKPSRHHKDRDASSAVVLQDRLWPQGLVPYVVDASLPQPSRVYAAMRHWEARTAVRFVPRTWETSYVRIVQGSGCSAHVGRIGGEQFVYLHEACTAGNVVHELGHTLGFFHEQSRVDRDAYVSVRWENVAPDYTSAFMTYQSQGMPGRDMGPYDFNSIMHYDSYAFSGNGRPTLVRRDGSLIYANRSVLSGSDVLGGASLYGWAQRRYFSVRGDFNGDGKTDLATLSPNGGGGWRDWLAMELSTGTGFQSTVWPASTPIHMRNGGGHNDYLVVAADLNGDGKTDVASLSHNASGGWNDWIAVELSTGSGFRSQTWYSPFLRFLRSYPLAEFQMVAGDFNGDGKDDLAIINTRDGLMPDWIGLQLSTGWGFQDGHRYAVAPLHARNGGREARYLVASGDFNGDGKDDLAFVSPNGRGDWAWWAALEISTDSGFDSQVWWMTTPQHMRNGGQDFNYHVVAADFNGDGKTDLATLSPNGRGSWRDWAAMELSTGTGFQSTVWPASTPIHMRNGGSKYRYQVLAGDFTGDGKADIATLTQDGGGGWRDWVALEEAQSDGVSSTVWPASTPIHMRNGG